MHTDVEGVAGWVFYGQRDMDRSANREHTHRMNALFTGEVVAACEAALDAGASEIYINDAHGPCHSVDFERLPAGCRIIHGRPGYFDAWLSQLDETFDAMICVGQHAMAGTPASVCPHSMWHVNDGLKLSETTMAAALAGTKGVRRCW
ncbi:M55 family metallopeptidase [Phycisphaerales bacterium AB-hyl4]|uniref:M55 family metallopeptidase n=1 Tax=Natronomicrosphaera hydrolytica TaxID=3242702 RepID=A0ABV4U695_9BACT